MKKRRRNRRYYRCGRPRWQKWLVILASGGLVIFGAVKLIGYGVDMLSVRQTSQALRDVYYHEAFSTPEIAEMTPWPALIATPGPTVPASPAPTQTPAVRLPGVSYPDNPKLQVSSRFKALQKESKYIVGWLTVNSLLDEPVAQKDNEYFLTRDIKGKENANGALFLDEAISLKTRPYTLIIYGHNMKSGAMFGNLRNYENGGFYHNNPFISFDTMYETGRYVIFAVGTISTEEGVKNSADFLALMSSNVRQRQTAIDALLKASLYSKSIDVKVDDQLLLLVTCAEKDDERRVVAARRIRDGEDEDTLKKLAQYSRKKQPVV